jgi:hypothetical protein
MQCLLVLIENLKKEISRRGESEKGDENEKKKKK